MLEHLRPTLSSTRRGSSTVQPTCRERGGLRRRQASGNELLVPDRPCRRSHVVHHTATIDGLSPARPLALAPLTLRPPPSSAPLDPCSQEFPSRRHRAGTVSQPWGAHCEHQHSSQAAYKKETIHVLHLLQHLQAPRAYRAFPSPSPPAGGPRALRRPARRGREQQRGQQCSQLERASPLLSGAKRAKRASSGEQRDSLSTRAQRRSAAQCSAAQRSAAQRSAAAAAARPRAEPGGVV